MAAWNHSPNEGQNLDSNPNWVIQSSFLDSLALSSAGLPDVANALILDPQRLKYL